jgi:hypothetical protein
MLEENSQILDVKVYAQTAIPALIYPPILTLITYFVERRNYERCTRKR